MRFTTTGLALLFLLLLLTLGACGGSGDDKGSQSPTVSQSQGPAASAEPYGKIVFLAFRDGNQEVYIMDADGNNETNLTKNPAQDFDPELSPDGSEIDFVSDRMGITNVYLMNTDGSNLREVAGTGGALSPHLSHDNKRLTYTLGGDLYVLDLDGGAPVRIMQAEDERTAVPCRAGSFPGSWSPDDQRIAYYAASVTRSIGQVCTIGADGSDMKVVVDVPNAYSVEPDYSPDGKRIVYRQIVNGQHDIWTVDLDTGVQTNLTHDPDTDIEPNWSPDGQWIAFGSLRPDAPNFDLFVMRPDGTDVRRLTEDPTKEANPAWGP